MYGMDLSFYFTKVRSSFSVVAVSYLVDYLPTIRYNSVRSGTDGGIIKQRVLKPRNNPHYDIISISIILVFEFSPLPSRV